MCLTLSLSMILGAGFMNGNVMVAEAEETTLTNEQKVYNYLVNTMGLNTAAACAVMANMSRESGFRPTALGDNGTSYGLCQWHLGRWENLKNYCSSRGFAVDSIEGQMSFFQYEIETTSWYATTKNALRNTPNTARGAYDTAYTMCVNFEIPANKEIVGAQRGYIAQSEFWKKYGNICEVTANSDYATYITDSTVVLTGSVIKPANVNISSCGVYLGKTELGLVKSGSEVAISDVLNRDNGGNAFSITAYSYAAAGQNNLNLTLQPGTKYYYQFYFIADGVEYRGNIRSFTTGVKTEGIYIAEDEIDIEYDYVAWYNKANLNVGNGSAVTRKLNVSVVPEHYQCCYGV